MLNFLVAYDEQDISVGTYLYGCYSDLESVLETVNEKNLILINNNESIEDQIVASINVFNGNRFFFIAYTHGNTDALVISHTPYITFGNASQFKNSFFYTCACSSAVNLGPELEKKGCLVFFGYNQEVRMPNLFPEVFTKCKNSGIKYFLEGNRTIQETYLYMIKTYEEECEKLSNQQEDSFLAAAFLRSNMNALVCLGNQELTLNDFT